MMTNPLPPQALDIVELLKSALSDPKAAKAFIVEFSQLLNQAKDAQDKAIAAGLAAEDAQKRALAFDGQSKANAIARENSLTKRESLLAAAETEFARKHEGHTFELQALERKKADLRNREEKHQQDAAQLSGFVAALDAREQALAKREAAVNDLDAKNKAFAETLERKKAHLDKIFAA